MTDPVSQPDAGSSLTDPTDPRNLIDIWHFNPSRRDQMRLPDEVLKCVGFIGPTNPSGDVADLPRFGATAFLVGVPTPSGRFIATYLVTAQHAAVQLEGRECILRFNRTDGVSAGHVIMPPDVRWWRHPTEAATVDVAVVPWKPPAGVDFRAIPLDWFLTDAIMAERDIGVGDAVYITGLFSKVAGRSRNMPLVRTGNLAMVPTELVPGIGIFKDAPSVEADVYLIEARSIGGISGSPVFIRETLFMPILLNKSQERVNIHGCGSAYLLGLVHGHWAISPERRNDAIIQPNRAEDRVNLGIAVVVPARKIREVLNHPELLERRAAFERRVDAEDMTEPDAV